MLLRMHVLRPILLIMAIHSTAIGQVSDGFLVPSDLPKVYYKIDATLDTSSGNLTGTEQIRIENGSSKSLKRLALDWNAKEIEIFVDDKRIQCITDSGSAEPAPVMFDLPKALSYGHDIVLVIKFSEPVRNFKSQDRFTLTEWYPALWWGINTHAMFDVRINVPSNYTLATSGYLDKHTGYYHAENVSTFGIFFGKDLRSAEAYAGDVLVRCVFTARGEPCARLVLETAVDAINFYCKRYGVYPYKSLNLVPGAESPLGGYPAAASLGVIHGEERMSERPEIHWQWITAHEIAHMYWGEYVIEKDLPDWLWIGLGIYMDREYMRSKGFSMQPYRDLMLRYTNGVLAHVNTTVAIPSDQLDNVDFDYNNIVRHGKGFSIISALANYLGRETFERIYVRCLKDFGGSRLGASEFQNVCENVSGQNLEWFFDAWIRSNKFLSYQVAAQSCKKDGNRYRSTVSVQCLGTLRMPVPVVAYFEDGSSQVLLTDRLQNTHALEFSSSSPLKDVRIDPDSELAVIVPPPSLTKADAEQRIQKAPWTGSGALAVTLLGLAQEYKVTEVHLWAKLGLMLYDGKNYAEALDAFQRTTELAGESENWGFAASVWQGLILDLLNRRDDAIRMYKEALRKEHGQETHHGQYGIVINRKFVEDRLKEPFRRN